MTEPTPGEEFAALIRGQLSPEPVTAVSEADLERDANGDVILQRRRPPKPDHSQGYTRPRNSDPAGTFQGAIFAALNGN